MALTKEQKQQVVSETEALLNDIRVIVVAKYQGTPVKAMQQLRAQSKENATTIRIIKNRLFKKALESNDKFKDLDIPLGGQMLYAFNAEDELSPAQGLAAFAKTNPQIEFAYAITADGQLLEAEQVKALAALPSKQQLRAQLVATIAAPISGMVNVLAGNLRGVLYVLQAHSEQTN